jgi:hypothetical protein
LDLSKDGNKNEIRKNVIRELATNQNYQRDMKL